MRRILFSRFLVAVSIVLVLFGVLACGNSSSPAQNPATPASGSPTQHPTSSGAPVSHTPAAQARIALSLDKQHYTTRDHIEVRITNHLSTPIFVSSYYTNCTVVSLELNIQNTWQRQGRCLTAAPHNMALQPGASLTQQLSPTAATPQMAIHAAWRTGTYRVALHYTLSPDEDITQGEAALSNTFSIS